MKNKLFCPIRKLQVTETPEEKVRQRLLHYMVSELQFPLSTISVERALSSMPHIEFPSNQLPERRADLVCFAKDIHPKHSLYPLLLVECKATPLNEKALQQLVGYNFHLQAYFIALANEQEITTGCYDAQKGYVFQPHLPNYKDLCQQIKNKCLRTNQEITG